MRNPRSRVAADILGGLDNITSSRHKLLYLDAAAGTLCPVLRPSDQNLVYAVGCPPPRPRSRQHGEERTTSSQSPRMPATHRVRIVGMVDTIFADVAQPDQARIVALNAKHFLGQRQLHHPSRRLSAQGPPRLCSPGRSRSCSRNSSSPRSSSPWSPTSETTPSSAAPTASARRRTSRLHGIASIANL